MAKKSGAKKWTAGQLSWHTFGRNQGRHSHGSNTDETRIQNDNLKQEQTEKTETNPQSLFSPLSPVKSSFRKLCGFVIRV
jgi:hypothetical protein